MKNGLIVPLERFAERTCGRSLQSLLDRSTGTMNLRRLNQLGIDRFTEFLDSLSGDTPLPYPLALLEDSEATEEVSPAIEIERRAFGSRFAAAEYLFNLFKDSDLTDIERDRGLWAWLSLFYFDELCPADAKVSGNRANGRDGYPKPAFHGVTTAISSPGRIESIAPTATALNGQCLCSAVHFTGPATLSNRLPPVRKSSPTAESCKPPRISTMTPLPEGQDAARPRRRAMERFGVSPIFSINSMLRGISTAWKRKMSFRCCRTNSRDFARRRPSKATTSQENGSDASQASYHWLFRIPRLRAL